MLNSDKSHFQWKFKELHIVHEYKDYTFDIYRIFPMLTYWAQCIHIGNDDSSASDTLNINNIYEYMPKLWCADIIVWQVQTANISRPAGGACVSPERSPSMHQRICRSDFLNKLPNALATRHAFSITYRHFCHGNANRFRKEGEPFRIL